MPMDAPAFVAAVQGQLGEVQAALLASATEFRDANIVDVASYDELKAAVAEGERGWWGVCVCWWVLRGEEGVVGRAPGDVCVLAALLFFVCLLPGARSPSPAPLYTHTHTHTTQHTRNTRNTHNARRQVGARRLGGQRRAGDAGQGGDGRDAALHPL